MNMIETGKELYGLEEYEYRLLPGHEGGRN